jgi:hypothetical protein
MGNPTSSILSEVYLQSLEDVYVQRIVNEFGVIYYKRYVDDCFLIIDNEHDNTNDITNYLNSLNPNIQFTSETETDGQLNYLDLNIARVDNRLEFSIYRKPTTTDHTIHSTSNHPTQHKLAAYKSMIHRLHTIPMTNEKFQNELHTIHDIAQNNGFTRKTIDKLITQHKNKHTNTHNNTDNTNKTWITLTYIGKETYRLKNFFTKHNINTAFKTNNQIGQKLKQNTDKRDIHNDSGVYKLTCKDCENIYIGRTGRTLKTRYKEHIRSYIHNKLDSNYAHHLNENGHQPDTIDNTMTLLHRQSMGPRLNVLEKLEIYKHKTQTGQLINEQLNNDSDITFSALKNTYRKRKRDTHDNDHTPHKKHKLN